MAIMEVQKWAKNTWQAVSIEPVFFLFALAQGFYLVVAKNLYVDKVKKTGGIPPTRLTYFSVGVQCEFKLLQRDLRQHPKSRGRASRSSKICIIPAGLQQHHSSKQKDFQSSEKKTFPRGSLKIRKHFLAPIKAD